MKDVTSKYLPTFFCFLLLMQVACGRSQQKSVGLWTIDISHDDRFIALGGDDSLLRIFTSDLKLYKSIKLNQGMIRSVQWHPKENLLAISTRNDSWVLNPVTGEETKLEGSHGGSRAIAWNYSGEMLASAAGHGVVWIWNRKGELLQRIQKKDPEGKEDTRDFLGMDWHPSRNILVTVADEIRVFDTSGAQLKVFKHREQQAGLLTVKWHPSGEFFVTGDYGHINEGLPTLLQFWKPDGTLIKEWNESKKEFRNLRWNKEGTLLATASDALRIWTKDGDLKYSSTPGKSSLWGVDWTSNSEKLFTVEFGQAGIQSWSAKAQLLESLQ